MVDGGCVRQPASLMLRRMITGMHRSIALVSGGLDSVVSLARARAETDVRLVLFADYGQRAVERERAAVVGVATFYGLPYGEVDLGWLRALSPEGMRSGAESGAGPPRLETLDDVWIPNRNGLLLNAAAAYAESYRCDLVVTGFNREEAAEFPDNGAEYVAAVNRSFEFSTRNGVRVVSYTQDLGKREIVALGIELRAPLSLVWSCYDAGAIMCGRCASCRRLKVAIDAQPAGERPVIEFAE
jgi:7-cyano-7-deazaguanine synthase